MADPKYRIESDCITGLVARIVYLIRLENEGLGQMNCVCNDGSKVSIKLSTKKGREERCRRGIEIDGARLG